MQMIKKLVLKIVNRETVTYLVFGVLTTLVNYLVFWLALEALGKDSSLVSNALAFIVAVSFAYIANKLWVFKSKSWRAEVLRREIPSFLAARVVSFAIEELGLLVFADLLGAKNTTILGFNGTLVVKILLDVIVILLNYLFSKFFIFKKPRAEGEN